MHYRLINRSPVPCDPKMWADLSWRQNRTVARSEIGNLLISTVFTGLNQNPFSDVPLLFETMIFKHGIPTGYQRRTATWAEAEAAHTAAVQLAGQGDGS